MQALKPDLALLVDADQAKVSDVKAALDRLASAWTVSARICVRNWRSETDLQEWRAAAAELHLECIQLDPNGRGKNAADIELTIRAMDLLHGSGYRAFCLVSGDSDFGLLEARLRRQGCRFEWILPAAKKPAAKAPVAAAPPDPGAPGKPLPPKALVVPFAQVVATALHAAPRDDEGWTSLQALGQHLVQKPQAFGFPANWKLYQVLEHVPAVAVVEREKGQRFARLRA